MKCPHCNQALGGGKCSACGSEVLEESLFCHRCGMKRENRPADPACKEKEDDGIDFSKRFLCSDGNCIGVINEKGFCKACGKPYTGEPK